MIGARIINITISYARSGNGRTMLDEYPGTNRAGEKSYPGNRLIEIGALVTQIEIDAVHRQ